jgi:tetratricopeptide (TPR) repeat protein
VELLEQQVESARGRGALDVEMELQLRVAEVSERRLGDVGRATRTYRLIVERKPEHRGALDALARIYQEQSESEELAAVLSTLVGSTSGEEQEGYAIRLADTRLALGDSVGAAAALEVALAANGQKQVIRQRLRKLYEEQNDWAKVSELVVSQALSSSSIPEQVQLLREAATMRAERLQDLNGAAEVLEKASALVPDDRELLLQLCDAYNQCGRGDRASEALERIVASYGGRRTKELGDIHRRLGEAYLSQGTADRAKEEFEKAFRIEPGNVKVIARLAQVCLSTGDAKRAQQLYSSLIIQIPKLEPGGPVTKAIIYGRRGEASLLLGERDKAKMDLERALKEDPSLGWVREKLESLKA